MDESIYETHYHLERRHWWFLARKEILLGLLERLCPHLREASVLDIGAGTGSYVEEFEKRGIRVEAHEASPLALAYLARSSSLKVVKKQFPEDYFNSENDSYDVVLLLDVLEHIADDREALATALRLLKPGGLLFCTVPACPAMWGPYDIVSHHFRRYTLAQFRALLDSVPVAIKKLSYFSSLLFPFLFLVRLGEKLIYLKTRQVVYRAHLPPEFLNRLLFSIFRLEKYILPRWNFPFGSSILAILEKE